jgi:CubicO group peptidase (beta-lactamase class C family)
VRGGGVVAEWNHGVDREEQLWMASAAKSIFSCMLGIAIEEGKIPSADARIADYYPEAMDVPEGEGPKEGRYVFPKDQAITFRQLISNTSGYMKPGEEPGKVFHYQTYGMNILTHAIAKIHGLYDTRDPEGSPGLRQLVDEKLRSPIGATWGYYLANFDLHSRARIHTFGYYDGVTSSALDLARLGWLWRNWGRWEGRQLVPEAWLREATRTAPDIRANCPREQWQYGYAFWTNDHGQLWPSLPRDSYAASGAGSQHIWVCPSLDMVVVQSPGLWQDQAENDRGLLRLVVDACQ